MRRARLALAATILIGGLAATIGPSVAYSNEPANESNEPANESNEAANEPAAEPPPPQEMLFGGNDWFIGLSGVLAISNADVSGQDPGGGAKIYAGFRLNPYLATNIDFEWIKKISYSVGSFDDCAKTAKTATGSRAYNSWSAAGDGRLYAGQGQFQPYALVGGGVMNTRHFGGGNSCKWLGFVSRFGVGLDVFTAPDLAVSLQVIYLMPTGPGADESDYVSIGMGILWY